MRDALKDSKQGQNKVHLLESEMKLLQEQLHSDRRDHDTEILELKEAFKMSQKL